MFQQHVALVLRQRHVLLPATINQLHRCRAASLGRRRAIRRHGSAAEDGDLLALELELGLASHEPGSGTGVSPVRIKTHGRDARATTDAVCQIRFRGTSRGPWRLVGSFQKRLPRQHQFLAWDVQFARLTQAGADDDGVMLRPKFFRASHGFSTPELHVAQLLEEGDVGTDNPLVQPEIRDEIHRPAEALLLLVNRHLVAALRQHRCCAQTGRPGADNPDRLAVRLRVLETGQSQLARPLHDRRLDGGNFNGPVEGPPRAGLHAEVIRANHTADPAERIRAQDHRRRPAQVRGRAAARRHDEICRRAMRRAGCLARLAFAADAPFQLRSQPCVGE